MLDSASQSKGLQHASAAHRAHPVPCALRTAHSRISAKLVHLQPEPTGLRQGRHARIRDPSEIPPIGMTYGGQKPAIYTGEGVFRPSTLSRRKTGEQPQHNAAIVGNMGRRPFVKR